MKTIAIIPTFNDHGRLQSVVHETSLHVDQVVVVDDGSTVIVSEQLQPDSRVTVLRHIINLGKGAALKTGITWAIYHQYDLAVLIDADGQHDPKEIPQLLRPLVDGQADIVFGIRKFHGRMPLVARFGNMFLTKTMKFLYRIQVDDTQSGFRSLRLSAFERITWLSARYAVETEMIVNAGKHKVPFAQVPISTIYHDKYKGTTIFDGFRIMLNMLTWRIL